jgi:Tfp pilus assembly protein PilO
VKKKLKALDVRLQVAAVAFLLILVAALGYKLVVSPQNAQAAKIAKQVDAEQTQIFKRQAELRAGLHPPMIKTADLFRLARAMPDREDMPGIILTLSELANDSGVKLGLIQPVAPATPPSGSYLTYQLHLQIDGDFYGLSDFLYRLRSLVVVHDGQLEASGRLFNVGTLTFNAPAATFPQISATVDVQAYGYAAAAPAAGATTTTPAAPTTTDSTTTSTDSSLPSDATAAGATN